MPPTERINLINQKCRDFLQYARVVETHNRNELENYKAEERNRSPRKKPLKMSDFPFIRDTLGEQARLFVLQLAPLLSPFDVQAFLTKDNIEKHTKLSNYDFNNVGVFVSIMIDELLRSQTDPLEFDLPGIGPVHVPEHFDVGSFRPINSDQLHDYYRTHLLLSYLASYITTGQVTFNGNVGRWFAKDARGGHIILNGECGYEPCLGLREVARVDINGISGYTLLEEDILSRKEDPKHGGIVRVNRGIVDGVEVEGQIRSLSRVINWEAECYLNDMRVYPSHDINDGYFTLDPAKAMSKRRF